MATTYTVGLISDEMIKTYHFNDLLVAKADIQSWKHNFLNNNNVIDRKTTLHYGETDELISIRHKFTLANKQVWTMFLSKDI